MKVAVISFTLSKENYGSILQCYALQQVLRQLGHEPVHIRYREPLEVPSFKLGKLLTYLRQLPTYAQWYFTRRMLKRHARTAPTIDRRFDDFIARHLCVTPEIFTPDTLASNPPQADAYVCGSDQIWGGSPAYYLPFAPDSAVKIAYAPSLGGNHTFAPEYEAEMKRLLARLHFIGMREASGLDTVRRLGFTDAVQVPDPTLLLSAEQWRQLMEPASASSPYLFAYLLPNPCLSSPQEIHAYAAHEGLDVKYVANQLDDQFPKLYPTIEQWIGLIAGADRVVTNSFHCTVFALIMGRPVIYLPLHRGYERMNCRLDDLMEAAGLTHWRYQGDIAKVDLSNPNFTRFNQWREAQTERSLQYLHTYLR